MFDCYPLLLVLGSGVGFAVQSVGLHSLRLNLFGIVVLLITKGLLQLGICSVLCICHNTHLNVHKESWKVQILLLIRSIIGVVSAFFSFEAITLLPISEASTIFKSSPLFAVILAYLFLNENFGRYQILALTVNFIGIGFIAIPKLQSHKSSNILGVSCAILSALCSSLSYLIIRTLGTSIRTSWMNITFTHAAGHVILGVLILLSISNHPFDTVEFVFHSHSTYLIVGSMIVGAVSHIMITIGLQRGDAVEAITVKGNEIVCSLLAQRLFTTDPLEPHVVLGAILIIFSIIIVFYSARLHRYEQVEEEIVNRTELQELIPKNNITH